MPETMGGKGGGVKLRVPLGETLPRLCVQRTCTKNLCSRVLAAETGNEGGKNKVNIAAFYIRKMQFCTNYYTSWYI